MIYGNVNNQGANMTSSPAPSANRENLTGTIVTAGICVALTAWPGFGFGIFFVILPLLFWIPYTIHAAITVPETRRVQTTRILIWLGAVSLVGGIHYVRAEAVRHNADEIVARIDAFSARNGRCAADIDELGLSRAELTKKLDSFAFYICKDGKPFLTYLGTFEAFSRYHYDFENRTWVYVPD